MADRSRNSELMLVLGAGATAVHRLEAVVAAVEVACVVVVPPEGRDARAAGEVVPLIAAGQAKGAAVLLAGDARLARTLKADGVHLGVSDKICELAEDARATLGGRAIIGADAGRSRHEAMTLGELGADYVAFGIPDFVKDRETAYERQLELIAWWAEIFEVPCIAMDVATPEHAEALSKAGADYVALKLADGLSPAEAVKLAREWSVAIGGGRDRTSTGGAAS